MPTLKLTATAIPALRPKDEKREATYRDTVVRGLLLEVHPSGRRTFVAWGRIHGTGRAARLKLGVWHPGVFDLADARQAARNALHAMVTGVDPSAEKRRAKEAGTFGDLADSFLARAPMTEATRVTWKCLLGHERLKGLRARPTAQITRDEVRGAVLAIRDAAQAKGKRGTSATRTYEAIRRCYTWALEEGLAQASPCVAIKKAVPERPRARAYTDDELRLIVPALLEQQHKGTARAALVALHAATRCSVALDAAWSEFDLEAKLWTVPAGRRGLKARHGKERGLLVPLTAQAVELLRTWRAADPEATYLCPAKSKTTGKETTATRDQAVADKVKALVPDFRMHDFRATVNSWLSSVAGGAKSLDVRDAVLAHQKRGLERNYNANEYLKEKRDAFERWGLHLQGLAGENQA